MARKKKSTVAGTGAVSFNMTPMIDIVFNLLIFFILTSQFTRLEIEDVVLPKSITAINKDTTTFRNVVINIVNPDSPTVIVFGQKVDHQIRGGENELTQLLKGRKASLTAGETMNVILRADAEVPYEDVARVMLAAGAAQIQGWWITTEIDKKEPKGAP
jgi:biopolymer transport protein ExbD